MSIEKDIKRIADTLETLAGHIVSAPDKKSPGKTDQGAKTPAPPATEKKDPPPPPPPEDKPPAPPTKATLADINTAMLAKAGTMGDNGQAIFAMLAADYNGARGLNQLPSDVYAEVLAKVNALEA